MALTKLDLGGCSKLTGTLPPYMQRYSGQNRVTPGQRLLHPSLVTPPNHAGEITPPMVECLSSIDYKGLDGCGKLVLTGDNSELSITKVDLNNMNTLKGKL